MFTLYPLPVNDLRLRFQVFYCSEDEPQEGLHAPVGDDPLQKSFYDSLKFNLETVEKFLNAKKSALKKKNKK